MRKYLRFPRGLFVLLTLLPASAAAQDGFRFEPPRVTFHLKAGAAVPNAGGDLFDMVTDELTLSRRDFAASTFGADVALAVNERFDVLLSVSTTSAQRFSESRHWVKENDEPVEQQTKFRRTPATIGLKYHLRDRGRMIGNHAWVPNRVTPFVGATGGLMWYRFAQEGEFVDELAGEFFTEEYVSSGKALTAQLLAGVEYWTSPLLGLQLEGRYQFANAELEGDFSAFNEIDLRGFQLMAGVSIRL